MTIEAKSHIKMALESIQAFANDGTLDASELDKLMKIALADGKLDDAERGTLGSILTQAEKTQLSPEVATMVSNLRSQLRL